nr:MAG TPA: hypothetical protein [Caudoviricetes sp.]
MRPRTVSGRVRGWPSRTCPRSSPRTRWSPARATPGSARV